MDVVGGALALWATSFVPPFAGWLGREENWLAAILLFTAAALLVIPLYVSETRRRHAERDRDRERQHR